MTTDPFKSYAGAMARDRAIRYTQIQQMRLMKRMMRRLDAIERALVPLSEDWRRDRALIKNLTYSLNKSDRQELRERRQELYGRGSDDSE